MNERIIENLKKYLGIESLEKEGQVSFFLDILIQKIKNYCFRDDIPKELELLIVEIMADYYNKAIINKSSEVDTTNKGDIKAITRGDTRIEYNVANKTSNEEENNPNYYIISFKKELIRFKKVGSITMNDKYADNFEEFA